MFKLSKNAIRVLAVNQVATGANKVWELSQQGFCGLETELKPDETTVTIIVRESARVMLNLISGDLAEQVYVIDEELPAVGNPAAEWLCHQNGTNGTSNLIFEPQRILPISGVVWVKNGISEACAAADPLLNSIIYSVRGGGTYVGTLRGLAASYKCKPLQPSDPKRRVVMIDALLNEQTKWAAGAMLTQCGYHVRNVRSYGSCLLHLWLLATGKAQVVVIDAMAGFWDAGLHLACQEVGCKVTDIQGNDITGPSKIKNGVHPFILGTAPGVDHEALLASAQNTFGKHYAGYTGEQTE